MKDSNVNASLCVYYLMIQRWRKRGEDIITHRMCRAAKRHIWELNSSPVVCWQCLFLMQSNNEIQKNKFIVFSSWNVAALIREVITGSGNASPYFLSDAPSPSLLLSTTANSSWWVRCFKGAQKLPPMFCCSHYPARCFSTSGHCLVQGRL